MKTRNTLRMRLLAFLLMIAMIGSNLTSMRVYAQEDPQTVNDTVAEEETQDAEIEEEETLPEEPEKSDGGGQEQKEEPVSDIDTSITAEDADEMPVFEQTAASESGIIVSADAPEGVFPAGTTMTVNDISKEDALSVAEETLGDEKEVVDAIGVDISFINSEGTEIEPLDAQQVHVTISLPEEMALEGEDFTLIHEDDEGNAGEVDSAEVTADGAEFDAGEFSNYIMAAMKAAVTYTLSFDLNGGRGVTPKEISQEDATFALPDGTGFYRTGYTFIGWGESKIDKPWTLMGQTGTELKGIYYEVSDKEVFCTINTGTSKTLYAVWRYDGKQGGQITVAVLKDENGTAPSEPQSYPSTNYNYLLDKLYLDDYRTYFKPVQKICGVEEVRAALQPAFYAKVEERNRELGLWNPETQYVEWYVIKLQDEDKNYHIDGVIRDKKKVSLDYNGNGHTGGIAPDGIEKSLTDGVAEFTVGDKRTLEKVGYEFTGWNTKKDGTGDPYQPGDTIRISEKTILYAQWVPLNNLTYTVHYYEVNTTNPVAKDKVVSGKKYGENVTESAISVDGYTALAPTEQPIKIDIDTNEITFYYEKRTGLEYTVNYLDKETGDVLKPAKTGYATFLDVIYSAKEVISIDGYEFVSASDESITISTDKEKNVINLYYTKRTDIKYTVNYLEKGTDQPLKAAKVENATFGEEITALSERVEIDGYKYDSTSVVSITIGTDEKQNVINLYYTKRTDIQYTVNYLEKDTENVLSMAKEKTATFNATIEAKDEIIGIDGYDYDSASKDSIVIVTDEEQNVINLYYTKRTDIKYTVNYLEKDTENVLSTAKEKTATFNATVKATNEVIDIDGYQYDSASTESITIGTDEEQNVINLYYTKRTDLQYTVNYLEKETNNALKDAKVKTVTFGEEITAMSEKIDIDGYNYDSSDVEKITIVTETDKNVINLYYTKKTDIAYTVNYLEKDTNQPLLSPKTGNATFGDVITASGEIISIDGYNYDSASSESITIGTDEEQNVINLYYTKRTDIKYTVNYLEKGTDLPLKDAKVGTATFGAEVTALSEKVEIDGYNFDSASVVSITISTDEKQNVINLYYTKRTDIRYTVNYLEKDTDNVLSTAKVGTATFNATIEAEDEIVGIDGYVYDSASTESITIGTDEKQNVINLYYTKRMDIKYTVNYLEKDTDNVLNTAKVANATFDEVIKAADEVIVIDGYYYDSASDESITISTDEEKNVIDLYYTKRTDIKYTVNYLEKDTENVLSTAKVEAVTFNTVIDAVDEVIEIDGYRYDSASVDSITIVTDEEKNVISLYYTEIPKPVIRLTVIEEHRSKIYGEDDPAEFKAEIEVISGVLPEGYEVKATLDRERKTDGNAAENWEGTEFVRTYDIYASALTVVDESGNDVTHKFVIRNNMDELIELNQTSIGIFEIMQRPVRIIGGSTSKVYDGAPLVYNYAYVDPKTPLVKYINTDTGVEEQETLESWVVSGSRTEVGQSDNVVERVVIRHNPDATANYDITFVKGMLTVTATPPTGGGGGGGTPTPTTPDTPATPPAGDPGVLGAVRTDGTAAVAEGPAVLGARRDTADAAASARQGKTGEASMMPHYILMLLSLAAMLLMYADRIVVTYSDYMRRRARARRNRR